MAGVCVSEALPCAPVPANQTSCQDGPITRTSRTTFRSNSCSTAPEHLRAHGPALGRPYGSYGRAEAVRALTTPILYMGLAADVLGRVPLPVIPLFLLPLLDPVGG